MMNFVFLYLRKLFLSAVLEVIIPIVCSAKREKIEKKNQTSKQTQKQKQKTNKQTKQNKYKQTSKNKNKAYVNNVYHKVSYHMYWTICCFILYTPCLISTIK